MSHRIAVVGTGYVGLTTGAYLAHLGHDVVCADVVPEKVERLNRGDVPILETGLDELVQEGLRSERLRFVLGAATAAENAEFVFLCVQTPQGEDGSADLTYIRQAASEIGPVLESESIVINKSTVPVGSTRVVEEALGRSDVFVVSNPEFLREGSAVHDCLNPDRIVIGADDQAAAMRVAVLFESLKAPLVITDPASAETIKYASNAFLATKVSFVNALANVCEAVGADVREVVLGMGYDKRIGFEFLRPGPGWGGSCFHPDETSLVRRDGEVRLLSMAELFAEVERVGPEGWEALSWEPGEVRPEFLPIATFSNRPFEGHLLEVRTKMGRRALVTPDHPLVVGDGVDADRVGVKLAEDLRLDDWLPVAQGFPLLDDPPLLLTIAPRANERGTHNSLPRLIDATPAFWRVLGLYLAEGHTSSLRATVLWCFGPDEDDLVEDVVGYWTSIGVRASARRAPTSHQAVVNSAALVEFFDQLGLGRRSYVKAIPDEIWARPEAEKRALLRGLWDGDGSWSYVAGGPSVVFEYGTVSKALADGMLRLLGDVGVVASLRVGRTAKSTCDTYWIRISGADQLESCWFLLPDAEHQRVMESIRRQSKRIAPTGYRRLSKNAAWVRVTSVEPVPYDGPVYSVHVPGPETVVLTNGLVTRQCFPKDTRAMVHIAEEHGYDFNLLRGVIAVNEEQYERMAAKVERMVGGSVAGCRVAALGMTFKARTDDLRDSPAIEVLRRLRDRGAASIRAFDPGVPAGQHVLDGVEVMADPYAACEGADVLVVLTEWDDFRWLDFAKLAGLMTAPRIVDTRNLLEPAAVRRRGFAYDGIGRT